MRVICGLILFCCTMSGLRADDREKLLMLISGEWVSRGIYVATKLEIADHLQLKAVSIEELAKLTGSHSDSLYRLMHLLAGFGVFKEVSTGVFANSEASALLVKSNPDTLHDLSLFYGEDIHKSWDELLPSVQSGTPAFELSFKQPVFAYFKENPKRGLLFQMAMKEKSMAVIKSVLSSYDFSKHSSVYDIGGGHGQFMKELVNKFPDVQGTVFDLPGVVNAHPSEGYSLVGGDFFESVPKGGDVYLLKSVIHDWDDEKAEKILSNCYSAMESNSRLVIVDVVLQEDSLYANCMDLLMLAITGGKERDLNSFKCILEATGFVLENVYPTGTEFSILEARKNEDLR